ncbi:MAG: tryptophan synthase subunit beta, partial [Acidihalobacter sp.]
MATANESLPGVTDWDQYPDSSGHFGPYGGCFVAETLMDAIDALRDTYAALRADPAFWAEFDEDLAHYVG